MSLIEREWLLYPSDYDGDAEAPEGHERLIAVGPPVVGPNLAVVPASQLRGAVSTVETHLHEPPRAPKGVRQADFRRGWEAARQAALIALGGAEREYPE
jgi:hypothetical protein